MLVFRQIFNSTIQSNDILRYVRMAVHAKNIGIKLKAMIDIERIWKQNEIQAILASQQRVREKSTTLLWWKFYIYFMVVSKTKSGLKRNIHFNFDVPASFIMLKRNIFGLLAAQMYFYTLPTLTLAIPIITMIILWKPFIWLRLLHFYLLLRISIFLEFFFALISLTAFKLQYRCVLKVIEALIDTRSFCTYSKLHSIRDYRLFFFSSRCVSCVFRNFECVFVYVCYNRQCSTSFRRSK